MSADATVTTPPALPFDGERPLPPSGTTLADRFRIESLAGRGGMGSVYRATDLHSRRPVALKPLHAVTSPEAAYRFKREAVLLAELHHPAIVSYVAHGTIEEGQPLRMQELHLNGMTRKAGARLVREVLGPQVPEDFVQRAVEHSDGNALFLEELIRMVAEGRAESAPETVLAVLQARLLRMEPPLRQVLLAASVFGRTFWAGGVRELLGPQGEATPLDQHLRQLVEQEIIEALPTSRLLAESEYRFRHALMRDAAYGLLPDNHHPTSHRLAATWMERTDEPDALVLATHYRLGQWPERAVQFHARAAEQLFERHDQQGTLRCVDEALACGVEGEPLLRLRALQAVVAFWMEQMPRSLEFGRPALAALKPGSPLWCRLMGSLIMATGSTGHMDEAISLSARLLHTTPEPEAIAVYAEVLSFQGVGLAWIGARQVMEVWLGRLVEMSVGVMARTLELARQRWGDLQP